MSISFRNFTVYRISGGGSDGHLDVQLLVWFSVPMAAS